MTSTRRPRNTLEPEADLERIDSALDAGGVAGTWYWDVASDRFTADKRFAKSFGLDRDALAMGVSFAEVVRHIHPHDAPLMQEHVATALAAGGPYRAEYRVLRSDGRYHWLEAKGQVTLDGHGKALCFPGAVVDVDGRKQAELRQAALLALGDELRGLDDAASIAFTAARLCGQTLEAGRSGYGEVDASAENVLITRDWRHEERMPPMAGYYQFADFGSFIEDMKRGAAVAIPDVALDPRTASRQSAFASLHIRALLNVPLLNDTGLAGVFTVHHDQARPWTPEEIDFVHGVADRTWAAMAASTAMARLRNGKDALEREVEQRTADRNALWQLSADVMLRATFAGQITAANPAWQEVLGWSVDEVVGTNLFDLVHPDDLERSKAGAALLAQGDGLARFDNRYRHRDGTYRWLSWSARPGQGLINAVGRDISADRKQAQALRDQEDFSRLALSAVGGVGVWHFDVVSDRFFCDASIASLYAIDPEAGKAGILRADFLANVLPEDLPALRAKMAGGLVNSGDLELEYRIRHPDGSVRWVLSRGHTYFDAAGKPTRRTGVGVDMTGRRLLEEQLRQSQKLEAIGQLTGGIAHDFNNILATLSNALALMRRRLPADAPADIERYLAMSARAVGSASSLTKRLLAFSRKQPLDIGAVDGNKLARGMEDLLARTLGESVSLQFTLMSDLWPARTDAHQLENALLNLAINARDAMPSGGTLSIESANVTHRAGDRIVGDELAPGDYVEFKISDTGTGMTAEVARRAFDPFYTTKPLGQGTGLGLSMIHGFAKQSGGDVLIESGIGRGTAVRILLPRSATRMETSAAPAAAPTSPHGSGESVLVVEDDPDVRRGVLDLLIEFGYRTSEAPHANAALALLSSSTEFDLLLTDVGLPGMTGRELATQARLSKPSLKVLFMTGYAKEAAVLADFLDDGMELITKPFAVDDLARRVYLMTRSR